MLEDPEMAGKWYMTTQYDEEEEDDDDDEQSEEGEKEEEEEGKSAGKESPSPNNLNGDSIDIKIDERLLPKMQVDVSLPAPADSLAHLFPLPGPEIMGDLVLQQCNLWLGNGKSGKSSGLHHDFHDNLYLLVSRFVGAVIVLPATQTSFYFCLRSFPDESDFSFGLLLLTDGWNQLVKSTLSIPMG